MADAGHLMNGALAAPTPDAAEIITMLEQVLSDARAGRLRAIGVIGLSVSGEVQCGVGGRAFTEVFFGAAMLQDKIMASLTRPKSGLVRPFG